MIDTKNLTIEKAHNALKSGEYTVRELCEAYLAVIKEKNPDINAYLEVFEDVMEQADIAQARFKDGTATMLTGIPLAIKDNMLIKGRHVSAGSKILETYKATYNSTAVENLLKENPVFLGRTNMDEFAMGSSTQTSAYGVTRNPLDRERVPGGSSGGSAAAVAMGGALAALGSETCGSIRQPAAFCGLVGFKPTYGSVSRSGLIAMGNSLDQIGPLTNSVADAEILHKAISSHDPLDGTTVPLDKRVPKPRKATMKIAVPSECMKGEGIDKELHVAFLASLEQFKKLGYTIETVEFKTLPYSLAVYYIVMPAEVSTNLERLDGVRYGHHATDAKNLYEFYSKSRGVGFGREARRRILLGTYVLSHGYYDAYYRKAILLREEITKEMDKTFESYDFIVSPAAPMQPFKLGEKMSDPVAMYLADVFSAPANLSGSPSIALPLGNTPNGLPACVQLTAPRWEDDALFAVGKAFETVAKPSNG
ncbi:MAG: Asp-tRNA(Asn)/Glu-tRNA(Gln) amidotransferase subunit GatA [Candidatus Pacebacteria bacterium]|nr:Asp-tRNA(Asn)/Glu-tRNA(Gln) amidotransferase subunit GatA [Candidatus Paceibacterota bacterium]